MLSRVQAPLKKPAQLTLALQLFTRNAEHEGETFDVERSTVISQPRGGTPASQAGAACVPSSQLPSA